MGDWHSDNERQHRLDKSNAEKIGKQIKLLHLEHQRLRDRSLEIQREIVNLQRQCDHPNRDKLPVDEGGRMSYVWTCLDCQKEL